MNIVELEPERLNNLNRWWLKPESAELIGCLEKLSVRAQVEYAELKAKAAADNGNENFEKAAQEKLIEATRYSTAAAVLKVFFPDGPFIARIEL